MCISKTTSLNTAHSLKLEPTYQHSTVSRPWRHFSINRADGLSSARLLLTRAHKWVPTLIEFNNTYCSYFQIRYSKRQHKRTELQTTKWAWLWSSELSWNQYCRTTGRTLHIPDCSGWYVFLKIIVRRIHSWTRDVSYSYIFFLIR